MSDYRSEVVSRIERSLASVLEPEKSKEVVSRIICILSEYEVAERHTELVVYDDSNERVLMQYAACLAVEGKPQSTIKAYGYVLRRFFDVIHKPVTEVGRYDVRTFLAHEKLKGLSDTTIRNNQSYLSAFFRWAVAEEIIDRNPCDAVKAVKCPEPDKTPFSPAEIDAMRSACRSTKERAVLELLVSSGVRVSELANLDVSDVDFANKTVRVRQGKGGKNRVTHMSDVARHHLQKYLLGREESDILIESRKGRYKGSGIWKMLQGIAERAGVDHVYPHRFRHTCASSLASRGMPIQEIQKLLGHSSINTTLKYVHTSDREVKASYDKYIA